MGMQKRDVTLQTKELSIGYPLKGGESYVVHSGVNAELRSGEVTCLMGLNGAGKSTLLRTICGFQPALSGEVEVMGRDLSSYSQHEISLLIGVVLTEKTNCGGITLYDLVSLGRHPYTGFFGSLSQNDRKVISESIEAVGISHKSNSYVSQLSDGERQKAMIAKALAQESPIIILDEPTAFLDVTSRIETMHLLRKLARSQNKSILLSTHDLDMAIELADSLWLQKKGEPLHSGTPEEFVFDGTLSRFFDRNEINFDIVKGRLTTAPHGDKIGVEGESVALHWLSNALVRDGFVPSPFSNDYPSLRVYAADSFELFTPSSPTSLSFSSIREVTRYLSMSGAK